MRDSMDKLEKEAAEFDRGLWDRTVGKVHPAGVLDTVFNPEFTNIFNKLKQEDAKSRDLINKAKPRELLKSVKSNINRREYLLATADLTEFHDVMSEVKTNLFNFSKEYQEKIHSRFLFDPFKDTKHDKKKQKLYSMIDKFSYLSEEPMLFKNAGLGDLWHNMTDARGRALKQWENRFPKEASKIKEACNTLLENSYTLLDTVSECFKIMSKLISKRDLEGYEEQSIQIRNSFDKYHELFKGIFKSTLKPILDRLKAFEGSNTVPETTTIVKPVEQSKPVESSEQNEEIITEIPGFENKKETGESYLSKESVMPKSYTVRTKDGLEQMISVNYSNLNSLTQALNKLQTYIKYPINRINAGQSRNKDKDIQDIKRYSSWINGLNAAIKTKSVDKDTVAQIVKEKKQPIPDLKDPEKEKQTIPDLKAPEDKKEDLLLVAPDAKFKGPGEKIEEVKAYNKFVNELQVFANEEQSFLLNKINRFANSIQNKNPKLALKLINIIDNLS